MCIPGKAACTRKRPSDIRGETNRTSPRLSYPSCRSLNGRAFTVTLCSTYETIVSSSRQLNCSSPLFFPRIQRRRTVERFFFLLFFWLMRFVAFFFLCFTLELLGRLKWTILESLVGLFRSNLKHY